MTTAQRLAWARWLRKLHSRASMTSADKERVARLAEELEQEGLEHAVDEIRPIREKL